MLYDKATLSPMPVRMHDNEANGGEEEELEESTILYGPTCDGSDEVARVRGWPRLRRGDWVVFPRMGAYTYAAASDFNGVGYAPEVVVLGAD